MKSGRPVTVHYTKDGNNLIAQRVIVRKATTALPQPTQVIEEKTTTVEKKKADDDDDEDDDDDDDDK